MGFDNKDIFIISAKDLTFETEKTYLNMSFQQTILKSEAPVLAAIYGNDNVEVTPVYDGSYDPPLLSDNQALGKKIGNYYVTSGNSRRYALRNNDFTESYDMGLGNNFLYNYSIYEKDGLGYLLHQSGNFVGSMQVATIDLTLSDANAVAQSFTVIGNNDIYFLETFGTSPGPIDERFYQDGERFYVVGNNDTQKKFLCYALIDDVLAAPSVSAMWQKFDMSPYVDLVTYPAFFQSGQDSLYFYALGNGDIVLVHDDYDILYKINVINQTVTSLLLNETPSGRVTFSKSPDGRVFFNQNYTNNTYVSIDLSDFSVVSSGSGSRIYVGFKDGVELGFGNLTTMRSEDVMTHVFYGNVEEEIGTNITTDSLKFIRTTTVEPRMVSKAYERFTEDEVLFYNNNLNGVTRITFTATISDTFVIEAQTIPNSQHQVFLEKK